MKRAERQTVGRLQTTGQMGERRKRERERKRERMAHELKRIIEF